MYYKLSNTASKNELENALGRPLKYPYLYKKQILINGLNEVSVPIVSMEDQHTIVPAIWGLLPEGYKGDWSDFQNLCNTLNVSLESMDSNVWYAKSLRNKRCLIPVTGFFTFYISSGTVYSFYLTRSNGLPFCLAGLYTQLDDGFISCSIITRRVDAIIEKIHNLGQGMPIILNHELHAAWLQESATMVEIKEILYTPHKYQIKPHSIAGEFHRNNISHRSLSKSAPRRNTLNNLS